MANNLLYKITHLYILFYPLINYLIHLEYFKTLIPKCQIQLYKILLLCYKNVSDSVTHILYHHYLSFLLLKKTLFLKIKSIKPMDFILSIIKYLSKPFLLLQHYLYNIIKPYSIIDTKEFINSSFSLKI